MGRFFSSILKDLSPSVANPLYDAPAFLSEFCILMYEKSSSHCNLSLHITIDKPYKATKSVTSDVNHDFLCRLKSFSGTRKVYI